MTTPLKLRPAATAIDWEIIKGDTFDIVVPVYDENDQLTDLTGWTGKAQVRRSEDEPLLHEWSNTTGNLTCGPAGATLEVLAAETSLWEWTDALVSVEVYEPAPGSTPHVVAEGPIRARQEITHT